MSSAHTVLVIGPHGVTGGAIARRLAADQDWQVITASRRGAPKGSDVEHLRVDLLDPNALAGLECLKKVTHVVYAAYTERPTMAEMTAPNLAMLTHTLDGLKSAGARTEHVVLIGGGKSYGEHLGPYKTPAKEGDPRFLGPIFYNDQEDLLAVTAELDGFAFTVLRPDVAIGFSLGSPMNLLGAIGVYAALSQAEGVPLRFPGGPGTWTALHQFTDTDLLAKAVQWALTANTARGEVFNLTNGDQFRWEHLWEDIAGVFEMPTAAPQPMRLAEQMADKGPLWDALVARHQLRPTPCHQIAPWDFADGVWWSQYDSVDSHHSITSKLRQLRQDGYLP